MPEAKTRPTAASVTAFLADIEDLQRRQDCETLNTLMQRATGCTPVLWGANIIGFDVYRYPLASGKQGESCLVGYSPRKVELSIYLLAGYETPATQALLARLGRHRVGKACLCLKRLADVDEAVLLQLISRSVAETRRRHPPPASKL